MVSVLYIGQYKKEGKFTTSQWKYFIEWCKAECSRIIVYSRMSYNAICIKFPLYCNIIELEHPDEFLDVCAYEINVVNDTFWNYIKEYNYNIDVSDDISHIYFFDQEKYIASLEIVDYENYVLIEGFDNIKNESFFGKDLKIENLRFCTERKLDIDKLVQEESWKPLGCD